jgi:hypothetical protein
MFRHELDVFAVSISDFVLDSLARRLWSFTADAVTGEQPFGRNFATKFAFGVCHVADLFDALDQLFQLQLALSFGAPCALFDLER